VTAVRAVRAATALMFPQERDTCGFLRTHSRKRASPSAEASNAVMKLALFGGTFDPIHRGHLAVARVAQRRYGLQQVLFVPSGLPPHKPGPSLTPFHDRHAMVALATAGEDGFFPSRLEDPELIAADRAASGHTTDQAVTYSIDTVRRLKRMLEPSDRLFFLIGIDAFLDIAKWREPEALLREAEFLVANRPGFSLPDVLEALPEGVRATATLHLLASVQSPISATQIRSAARRGRDVEHLVGPAVADYIRKAHLYRPSDRAAVCDPAAAPACSAR
jgi:nicotinate-nucleotide adenylyltransferase